MSATKTLWDQMLLVGAVVIAFIWVATESTAWRLGLQSQLGHPRWFELLGSRVCLPPTVFCWWFAYEADPRDILIKAVYVAAPGGIAVITVAIATAVWRAREGKRVTTP